MLIGIIPQKQMRQKLHQMLSEIFFFTENILKILTGLFLEIKRTDKLWTCVTKSITQFSGSRPGLCISVLRQKVLSERYAKDVTGLRVAFFVTGDNFPIFSEFVISRWMPMNVSQGCGLTAKEPHTDWQLRDWRSLPRNISALHTTTSPSPLCVICKFLQKSEKGKQRKKNTRARDKKKKTPWTPSKKKRRRRQKKQSQKKKFNVNFGGGKRPFFFLGWGRKFKSDCRLYQLGVKNFGGTLSHSKTFGFHTNWKVDQFWADRSFSDVTLTLGPKGGPKIVFFFFFKFCLHDTFDTTYDVKQLLSLPWSQTCEFHLWTALSPDRPCSGLPNISFFFSFVLADFRFFFSWTRSLGGPWPWTRATIPREDPSRAKKKRKLWRKKKNAKFWAPTFRAPHSSGPHPAGPHPSAWPSWRPSGNTLETPREGGQKRVKEFEGKKGEGVASLVGCGEERVNRDWIDILFPDECPESFLTKPSFSSIRICDESKFLSQFLCGTLQIWHLYWRQRFCEIFWRKHHDWMMCFEWDCDDPLARHESKCHVESVFVF